MTYMQLIMTFCFWFALRKSSADGNSKPPKAPGPRAGCTELVRAVTKQDGEWELMTATEGCGIEGALFLAASSSCLLHVPNACHSL